jgi:hypothetical protein
MSQVGLGPVNITYPNPALFIAEFFNTNGARVVPSGATLSIGYINVNSAPQIDNIAMSANNSYFTATWSSTNAASGLAPWSVTVTGETSAAQTGVIRVLGPTPTLTSSSSTGSGAFIILGMP